MKAALHLPMEKHTEKELISVKTVATQAGRIDAIGLLQGADRETIPTDILTQGLRIG
jgi:hypothetical protein